MKISALAVLCALVLPAALRAETGAAVLAEMNLARTQPRAYAELLAGHSGKIGSSNAVRETIRFLEKVQPLPPFAASTGLALAAESHVAEQGAQGGFGHTGASGSHMNDRLSRQGQWLGAAGENIDYGNRDARTIVMRLIVDEGISGRKHRANIFHKSFRVAGAAVGSHARFGAMCVMDFAGGFVERGTTLASR